MLGRVRWAPAPWRPCGPPQHVLLRAPAPSLQSPSPTVGGETPPAQAELAKAASCLFVATRGHLQATGPPPQLHPMVLSIKAPGCGRVRSFTGNRPLLVPPAWKALTDRLIVYVQKREVSRHIKITKTNKRATVLTACVSRAPGSRLGPLTLITCLSVGPRLPVRLREVAWPVGRCDRHRCGHLGVRTPILFALPGAMPFGGGGTASVGVHLDWPVIIASCPWPRPGQGFGQ